MLKPLIALLALLVFAPSQEPAPPPAAPSAPPADTAHMANPIKPTPESQAKAKKLYGYDCAMCHGTTGNGKGDIPDLKPAPKDYTDPAALKDLTDGEIFNIIKNGKGQMPPDGGRTKPDDIWNMVILLRSFSKK
jgi:mono/diheme cytochrome c family protein